MVITVCREYHWTPHYIKNLYLDDIDFFGLGFWYEVITEDKKKIDEKIKKIKNKKKK